MTRTSSERAPSGRLALRALELAGHRAASSSWSENARVTREIVEVSRRPARERPGDVGFVVVLLAWKRRHNLALQAHLALSTPGVEHVVVSNNDPARALVELDDFDDPRLQRVEQPRPAGPVTRYQVARDDGARFFVALDDDLFLAPRQLSALVAELARDPEVPHGFYGQLRRGGGFVDNVTRSEGEVDVLNRGYAFTREHVARYFELLERLELNTEAELRELDDDLILSFSGSRRPRLHDLGAFADCPSERRRGALWRRRHAGVLRQRLYDRLEALAPRSSGAVEARAPARYRSPRSHPLVLGVTLLRLLADAHRAIRNRV